MHDGAVLIEGGLILAARCPLPITDQMTLPPRFGMRHRAAIGMSEHSDALIVVLSEESGFISVVDNGEIRENITPNDLRNILLMEKVWKKKGPRGGGAGGRKAATWQPNLNLLF